MFQVTLGYVTPCLKNKTKQELPLIGHSCNHSIWKVETGGPGVQSHPLLHSKFKASLCCNEILS